jgi:ABC-2 type transport system ATP-binding protein
MMDAIRAKNLTKRYGGTLALEGLSLSVAQGELVGLVGPDGAGKTTALRILAGILVPDGGEASVMGLSVVRHAPRVQDRIGYMSQRFGLYADLSVAENLRFYADLYGVPRAEFRGRSEELLGFSGLQPFRARRAGDLSGGMKQKLGLACALVHTPEVLLLDEPTNGVDPVSRRDFWRILYSLLGKGVAILVSTAYLDEAERCSRVGLMHRGRLLAFDAPGGLRGLYPGRLLEVRTGAARTAARVLRGSFPGCRVALFGDRVHLAAEAGVDAEAVVSGLRGSGVAWESVREAEPGLEDIFLSAVERAEAGS